MKKEQIEKTLETLKCYHELLNISVELDNVAIKKRHKIINDLSSEIEKIADLLMDLENELYYEYLKQ